MEVRTPAIHFNEDMQKHPTFQQRSRLIRRSTYKPTYESSYSCTVYTQICSIYSSTFIYAMTLGLAFGPVLAAGVGARGYRVVADLIFIFR